MLSPLDLENKRIVTKKRKYDKAQMDEYLELVFENYRAAYDENQELQKKLKTLSDGIQYYRSIETTMQKALVLAEKTSKETKDAAILKAEAIEKDATQKAEQIIDQAAQEYDRIREKCVILVQQFNQYKSQLKQVATTQLELVNSESFDVNSPNLDTLEPSDLHVDFSQSVHESERNEDTTAGHEEVTPMNAGELSPDLSEDINPKAIYGVPEPSAPQINETVENVSQKVSEPQIQVSEPSSNTSSGIEDVESSEALGQTTVLPNLKSEKIVTDKKIATEEETLSILTADTIDLSDSLKKAQEQSENSVKTVKQEHSESAVKTAKIETEAVVQPTFIEPKPAKVSDAIEPVGVKTMETLDVQAEKKEPIQFLEPEKPQKKEKREDVHSLDALLQSMNMGGNKKNKKGQDDDPFEFLGSVDDF